MCFIAECPLDATIGELDAGERNRYNHIKVSRVVLLLYDQLKTRSLERVFSLHKNILKGCLPLAYGSILLPNRFVECNDRCFEMLPGNQELEIDSS